MKNYSQNNEQQIILDYFGDRKGTFLDIGAYNGPDISNTWALLELGWQGIFVEPNPFNLVALIEACRPYAENVTVICAGAGFTEALSPLRIDQTPGRGWAASFSKENPGVMDEHPVNVLVPIIDTADLFENDFLLVSIDAEWSEDDILKALGPYMLSKTEMFIVEPGEIDREETKQELIQLGFKIHAETPENIIAAR